MHSKNNSVCPSSNFRFTALAVIWLCLLAFLAGCSLEGDISAVKRKAGIYTVAFNANGATSGRVAAAMLVRANSAVTLPGGEGLHYPGYVFIGWNADPSGSASTYQAGAEYPVTGNVTLYAMWGAESALPSDANSLSTPIIIIAAQPTALTNVTQGSIIGTLEVKAGNGENGTLKYQWYSSTENGIARIDDATSASFAIPPSLTEGAYYFFCEISGTNGEEPVRSTVAAVQVLTMPTLTTAHFAISGYAKTYNGSPQGVTVSYVGEGIDNAVAGIIAISYIGRDGTAYLESADAPVNAGTYDVLVSTSGGAVYAVFAKAVVGTLTIGKAAGADVSGPPVLNSKAHDSITLNAVSALSTGQVVEYACNTANTAPATGWQTGLIFSDLNPLTEYYLFARSQENANYNTGTASAGLMAKTRLIEVAWIPAGTFQMGSPSIEVGRNAEEEQHTVTLTNGLYMGVYQITQKQYFDLMGGGPMVTYQASVGDTSDRGRGDNYPMYYVSWYDALVFCNRLSMEEELTPAYSISNSTDPTAWGTVPTSSDAIWDAVEIVPSSTGYRLPTEAQWEYACRAGTTTAFNDGKTNDWNDSAAVEFLGWFDSNSGSRTHEVGKKAANSWGLYDMQVPVFPIRLSYYRHLNPLSTAFFKNFQNFLALAHAGSIPINLGISLSLIGYLCPMAMVLQLILVVKRFARLLRLFFPMKFLKLVVKINSS